MTELRKTILVFSFGLISLSTLYFLVFYLPSYNEKKLEILKQREIRLEDLRQRYDTCINNAANKYLELWNSNCKEIGLENGCNLPIETSKMIEERRDINKDTCGCWYKEIEQEN